MYFLQVKVSRKHVSLQVKVSVYKTAFYPVKKTMLAAGQGQSGKQRSLLVKVSIQSHASHVSKSGKFWRFPVSIPPLSHQPVDATPIKKNFVRSLLTSKHQRNSHVPSSSSAKGLLSGMPLHFHSLSHQLQQESQPFIKICRSFWGQNSCSNCLLFWLLKYP